LFNLLSVNLRTLWITSIICYSVEWWMMNNELERVWKEFEVLVRNSPERIEQNHGSLQSGYFNLHISSTKKNVSRNHPSETISYALCKIIWYLFIYYD
jgi:hypothetical protein